jgi:hypothetical protein
LPTANGILCNRFKDCRGDHDDDSTQDDARIGRLYLDTRNLRERDRTGADLREMQVATVLATVCPYFMQN